MDMNLTLIVGCSAAEEFPISDGRFECRSGPQIQRFRRLHIVMSVEKNGRFSRRMQRLSIYERMHLGLGDLNIFQARSAQFVRYPTCRSLDVGLMFAFCADTGDAKKFLELT